MNEDTAKQLLQTLQDIAASLKAIADALAKLSVEVTGNVRTLT